MPNYDYKCQECESITIAFNKYEDRDNAQVCLCGGEALRGYYTVPQVRTEKLSRTFVDGHKREGYEDLKKSAALEVEKLNHKPGSLKHHELTSEIKARKMIRPKSKYKLDGPKGDKK